LTLCSGHVSRVPPSEPADPRLAKAIRCFREERGLTQEHVAFQSAMSVSAYGQLERGASNPTWTTILRVAKALDVGIVELAQAVDGEDH
jgi:transcriptional regulator with XRE-family HTH domain